jgi:diguanylate cyclase (GGDEF)-like protein
VRDRLRYALFVSAAVFGAGVFAAFVFFESPGLGIAHFLYVAIILAAVAGGPWIGASAATIATAMYATGVLINPDIPSSEVVTMSTAIRFVTYVSVGVVTGYFANRNQTLMKELELLAERDALTGIPNTRAFERAITERLSRQEPFALLIGGVDSFEEHMQRGKLHADDVLRHVANRLQHALLPGDEVARVGNDQFAILTYATGATDAGRISAKLQGVLATDGHSVTFGWASFPQDGSNALLLFRAADERLYARRVIRRQPTVLEVSDAVG